MASARIDIPADVDVVRSLEGLRAYGDDLLDRWDGVRLLRHIPDSDPPAAFRARLDAGGWLVEVDDPADLEAAVACVSSIFMDPQTAALQRVAAADRAVAGLLETAPAVLPLRRPELMTALVRTISAQQVNLRWAATTRRRLAEMAGVELCVAGERVMHLDPGRLASIDPAEIRALQFTTRKAEYIVSAAQAIRSGVIDAAVLAQQSDEAAIAALTGLRGIGRWTAEWLLVGVLGRPLVVAGDLGVRRAVGALYQPGAPPPSEERVRDLTAHWGEAAAVLQQRALTLLY